MGQPTWIRRGHHVAVRYTAGLPARLCATHHVILREPSCLCADESCAKIVCRKCNSRWVAADRKRAGSWTLVKKKIC